MVQQVQAQEILNRLAALKLLNRDGLLLTRIRNLETLNASANASIEDLTDPPLILNHADGTPVSIETIEKIPDHVRNLPAFSGDPNEVST